MSLAEITAGMANERERERLAEIAELIKRVWVVVTKLSLRDKVQFRARQTKHSSCRPQSRRVSTARATRIQRTPTAATRTLTPQARATATLVLITTRLRVAPPASTRKTVKEPLHLQTRTTNLSSQIVPFRVWQVDNPVAGTPTTRTLQERARTSESCDLSPRRRPPRSACTTREEDAGPIE